LGSAARRLLVFDPPATVRAVSAQELAPIWDGAGLIVSAEPISTGKIFAPARRRFLLWTLGIVSLVLAFHRAGRRAPIGLFRSRRALLGLSLAQGLSLTLAALLGATLFHFFADEGLLANVKATDAIQRTHAGDFMPKVGAKRVRQLMEDETIFVDARFRRDFEAGHLRGAINVPIDANDVQRRHLTESIPKDAKVVVYCRSRSCRFADEVGFRLLNDGFTDVALYRGGWTDWIARGVRP
jgi:rhodanese-related sulfurtransferase